MSAIKQQKSRTTSQSNLAGRRKQHHAQGRVWVPPWSGAPKPRGSWRYVAKPWAKERKSARRYPCPLIHLGNHYTVDRRGTVRRSQAVSGTVQF